MPAAVYKAAGEIEVEQVPVPEVGADDVLVAVELCGICGSDLHMVLEGWGVPGSWHGHEWIGTVAAVGDGVTRWQPGDTVVGGPGLRCGECRMCKANRPSLCEASGTPGIGMEHGAFATYKLAPAAQVLPMPEGLDPRAAALAEPLSVALHGIHQGGTQPGDRVLVLGAGPIGALEHRRAAGDRASTTCAAPSPRPPARSWPPPSAPRGCSTPTSSRCRTWPSPCASSTTPSTSCSSAPARPRRWRPGWRSS